MFTHQSNNQRWWGFFPVYKFQKRCSRRSCKYFNNHFVDKQSALPGIVHLIFYLHSTCMLPRVNRHIDKWLALPGIVCLSFVDLHSAFLLPRVNQHIDKQSALPWIVCLSFSDLHSAFIWICDEQMALPGIVCWGLVEPFENLFATNATTNWSVEADLLLKDKELFVLVEPFKNLSSMDATTNWSVEEAVCLKDRRCLYCLSRLTVASPLWLSMLSLLNCFGLLKLWAQMPTMWRLWHKTFVVEVTGSNANNVKAWRETVVVEDTWTFTKRDWTQLVNPELRLEWVVEKRTRADEKLCLLLALAYWIEGKACWELASVACGDLWMISSSNCSGWLESDSGFCFVERTLRSSASHSNLWFVVWSFRLMIGSNFAMLFCLFVCSFESNIMIQLYLISSNLIQI